MPGPVGDYVREANAKMEADREEVMNASIDTFMELIGRPRSTGAKSSIVNMASQEQALNRIDSKVTMPEPIVINNNQTASASDEDPISYIGQVGDPGFSALFPPPY